MNIRQPAIVILDSDNAEGKLTDEPITENDRYAAEYWKQHAIIYRMGNRYQTNCTCLLMSTFISFFTYFLP